MALRFSNWIAPDSMLIRLTTRTTTRSANNAKYNEYGGTLGGPILHNRLFAFFGYDTIRNTGTTIGGGWYDTTSLDCSAPSGSIASKFTGIKGAGVVYKSILEGPSDHHQCSDIGLIQGVNCNWIQGQGLDLGKPLTIGLGVHDPSFTNPVTTSSGTVYTPGLGGDGTGSYATNMDGNADMFYVSTVGPNNTINAQYNGRLDYQVTTRTWWRTTSTMCRSTPPATTARSAHRTFSTTTL